MIEQLCRTCWQGIVRALNGCRNGGLGRGVPPRAARARVLDLGELEDRILMSVTPVGGETLVNTTTANTQQTQSETPQAVASDANGNFVVVWTDSAADGSGSGVYAQRFDASGAKVGSEFRVNTTTAGNQDHASVAMDDNGNFIVTWTSAGQDGSGLGVYAQRYNSSGVAQGGEFSVNSTTSGDQHDSAVAMDSSGNFVVTWTSAGQDGSGEGVYAQRYNAAGVAQGGEFLVNTTTNGDQNLSAVAMNASGQFVVTFVTENGNGNVGVRAQRYDSAGVAQGGQIQVNTYTNDSQSFGAVAIDGSGNFVVTWSSFNQDAATSWGVYAQRFDSSGATLGSETLVNTTTAGDQQWSRVAMKGSGDYVVTWASNDQDAAGTWGIYAQEFTSAGATVGTETRINTTTSGNQQYPAISTQGTGNFVVVWSGNGSGDASGVFFQRLDDGVNQGPINTVPGAQSTNEDTAIVFSSGNGNLISIADPDAGSSLMRVTLTAANGTVTLNGTTGLAFTSGDGTADATMQFTGTLANINTALNGLSFTPTNNFAGAASLTILTSDQGNSGTGGTLTDSDTVNITVNAVNDAPVFNVPGAQSVNEDTNLVFSSGNGNLISITDVDSGGSSIQVTLSATNGTLTLSGTTGLSFSAGDGTSDATMTFTGTRTNINTALAGMFYRASNNYNGAATISLDVNDQGNTGSGGAQTDSATVNVTVNAVNDPPVNTVPGAQSTAEDTPLVFSAGNSNQISVSDIDAGGASVQVQLTATNGSITLSGVGGLTFSVGDGTGDTTMTFTGTVANINTALNGLSFTPTGEFSGAASLQIITNDQGNTGSGGAHSDSDTVNITVTSVNDPPVNSVPGPQTTPQDTPLTFNAANGNLVSISDPDAGGAVVQVTLSVTNGTVTLGWPSATATAAGGQTIVNSTTTDRQGTVDGEFYGAATDNFGSNRAVATDDDGNYVVTWSSKNQDGDGWGIYAQRYNSAGVAQGGEFRVNSTTAKDQVHSSIAMDDAGNFAIVWSSKDQDGDNWGVYMQRYNAAGVAQGVETRVNTYTAKEQLGPSIAMDATGDFVVTWSSKDQDSVAGGGTDPDAGYGVYGQRYNAAGVAQGGEFRINNFTAKEQTASSVAMDASGNFIVTWASHDDLGGHWSVYARRYSANGLALGNEFQVNTANTGDQKFPSIASDANGNFVVTWSSKDQDGNNWGVYAQRYNSSGVAQGGEFQVNVTTSGEQLHSSVSMDTDGDFVITWSSNGQDGGGYGIYARQYTATGVAKTGETLVNTTTSGDQTHSSVGMDDRGNFVVVWSGNGAGDTLGVFSQRYTVPNPLTFTVGDGTRDTSMTFTGTIAQINAVLDGMVFTPTAGFNGLATVTLTSNDLGNSGSGGAQSDVDTININCGLGNSAPTVNLTGGAISYTENAPATIIDGGATVSDADSPDFSGGQLAIFFSANGVSDDQLAIRNQGTGVGQIGISGSNVTYNFGAGAVAIGSFSGGTDGATPLVITFNASANAAASQALIRNITYQNVGDNPGSLTRSVEFVLMDGDGGTSNSASRDITVTAMNDAPVNAVPGAQSTAEDTALVFSTANGNLISISDADESSGLLQVTLTVTNGLLSLAGVTGLTFSTGDGTSDATMTFTGTVIDINTALDGLSYAPSLDYNGAATLSITTNDQGNSGNGGPQSDNDSVAITVTAVNDAPVNTVPPAQSINEDSTLVFSSANGNQISIGDVDAGGASVQVTLTATNGTITLNGVVGLSFSAGDGTADSTMTFTGTITDINAALNGLGFTSPADYNGAASLQIDTNDQGNSGAGVPLSDIDTVNITVNAVNDAPVNTVPGPQSTNEDTSLVFSSGNGNQISISDLDAAGASVRVTLTATNGAVTLNGVGGLAFTVGDGTADSTMTFTGTIANINAALNGISFIPPADFNGAASLQILTDDLGNSGNGGPLTDSDTVNITVNPVNDAPVLDNTGAMALTTITEDDTNNNGDSIAAIVASAGGNRITDVDAGAVEGIAVTSIASGNGTWEYSTDGGGSWNAVGAVANNNALLLRDTDRLRFVPDGQNGESPTVTFCAWDQTMGAAGTYADASVNGGATAFSTATESATLTVTAVNDAPVLDNSGTMTLTTITEDDTNNAGDAVLTIFASAGGNRITDVDAGAFEGMAITGLVSGNGVWQFSTNGGGSWTNVGAVSDANALLLRDADRLRFVPDAMNADSATVTFRAWDQSSGVAGTYVDASVNGGVTAFSTATETASITVTSVNDAPVNTAPGPQSINEDTPLVFSTTNGNLISINDVDSSPSPVEVTLAATNGTLTLTGTTGLIFSTGDGTGDATMTFTGTVADINAALDGLVYIPTLNYDGPANVSISTNDLGNTGAGGPLNASSNVAITVIPENDAPTIVVPGAQQADTFGLVFSAATGNAIQIIDTDVTATDLVQISLIATNGTMTLGRTSGLTFLSGNGVGNTSMTFTGTLADVNAALDGLNFTPSDMNASIQITADDLGSNGLGGPQSATTAVAITQVPLITPVSPPATTPPVTPPATNEEPSPTSVSTSALVSSRAAPPPRTPGIQFTAPAATPISNQFNIRLASQRAADLAGMLDEALGSTPSRLAGPRSVATGLGIRAASLTLIDNDLLWSQLDSLARKMEMDQLASPMLVGATAGMGMALTSGYLLWCLRGGSLLASALSTMPMWRTFDPLPVLEFWEKQGNKKDADEEDDEMETNEAEEASLDTILT